MKPCDVRFHVYCAERCALPLTSDPSSPLRLEACGRAAPGWQTPPTGPNLNLRSADPAREAQDLVKVSMTVEDPADLEYLQEAIEAAAELARRFRGITFDVHGQRYLSARELRLHARRPNFTLTDHLIVHRAGLQHDASLHTHGLAKFGHADLKICRLPERHIRLGAGLLIDVASAIVEGMELEPGDVLDVGPGYLRVAASVPHPEDEPARYGRLDLLNYDLVTGSNSPDLEGFLDGVRITESAAS